MEQRERSTVDVTDCDEDEEMSKTRTNLEGQDNGKREQQEGQKRIINKV